MKDKALFRAYVRELVKETVEEEVTKLLPKLLDEAITEIKTLTENTTTSSTTSVKPIKPRPTRSELAKLMGLDMKNDGIVVTTDNLIIQTPTGQVTTANPEVKKVVDIINRDYSKIVAAMNKPTR